jgi:hypothetical protein
MLRPNQEGQSKMVYMFDFFAVEPAGNRLLLGTTKHRAKTRDLADAYGESMMRNDLFRDQKVAICVIKDQVGHTLREVFADA